MSAENSNNLDKMDATFVGKISLMEEMNLSFNINEVFQIVTDRYIVQLRTEIAWLETGTITNMKRESDIMMTKFSNEFRDDTTVADIHDNIISDVNQCQNNASNDNLKSIESLKYIKANTIIDIETYKNTAIQELQDIRDGTVADIAKF